MRDAALRFHCRFALGSFDRSAARESALSTGRSPAWIKVKNPDAPQDTLDFICARLRSRIGTQFIYKFGERGHH
jgi:hypothetical protein